jgi:hypothetical protein
MFYELVRDIFPDNYADLELYMFKEGELRNMLWIGSFDQYTATCVINQVS